MRCSAWDGEMNAGGPGRRDLALCTLSLPGDLPVSTTYPKIELHVHLEGSVRPELLFAIARRNDAALPVRTVEELRDLYRFRDFAHFIEVYLAVVHVLRTPRDFR